MGLISLAVALQVAGTLLAGFTLNSFWTAVLIAALAAVGDALVRPILRILAGRIGGLAALGLGTVVQVMLVHLAILVVPGADITGPGSLLATLLCVALVASVAGWLIDVNDSAYVVGDLVRRGERARRARGHGIADAVREPGVLIVQIDGMPHELLNFSLASGTLPTLSRWVRSGTHEPARWWARLPSTTPASQAGLLHGNNEGIAAFRWYEKELGRLVVTNRPADAALVEERLSNGRGLLADGGVSISNMFSGDAPTCQMVFSRVQSGGVGPGKAYMRLLASPFTLPRTLVLTVGEMVKELYQGHQQRVRGIEPRVSRRGSYVALRGLTNAILRDLNVALVSDHLMAGAPVIFVDFVDYDEIAHHAGAARPEALDALAGIDRVLGTLERVAEAAPRDYRIVVLSDHGQSQGATFRQLHDQTLEEMALELMGSDASADARSDPESVEAWGPVNAMLTELLGATNPTARWAKRRETDSSVELPGGVVGPRTFDGAKDAATSKDVVAVGSGNIGLLWFPAITGRAQLNDMDNQFPALIPGLLAARGVGFVVADSERGPVAIGSGGVHLLEDGTVDGVDPLAPFGPRARRDLLRVTTMANAPDLYVHSTVDARTGEVHAFEELVGCHGGLGGWQNDAVLVYPREWSVDEDLMDWSVPDDPVLAGADSVHRQLVRWLEQCGLRTNASPSRDS